MLLVDAAHKRSSGWQHFVDEDKDGLLWAELDALADDIDELADSKVCGDKVLLLVDGSNVGLLNLLTDDLDCNQHTLAVMDGYLLGCGRCTSDEYARLLPCASRRDARP